MKNIYLIPTEKASRLRIGNNGNFVFGMMQTYIQSRNDFYTNQHIYITSEDEIKEGDWFYLDDAQVISNYIDVQPVKEAKKIILTTDPDLIADGVQSIDDEFLEWFVKNPSCEWVGVQYRYSFFAGQNLKHYKITIPQEEPKQETLEEAGIIAAGMCEHLDAREQAFFIAGFIESAKWQQEQDKNKYSEEEVLEHLNHLIMMPSSKLDKFTNDEEMVTMKWFEQFKKK